MLKDIRKVVAHNLKEFRGKETQAAFAERIGMPYRTYQNMESGEVIPQAENLKKVAEAHGYDSDTVFFVDPDLLSKQREALSNFRKLLIALTTLNDSQVARFLRMIEIETGSATPRTQKIEKPKSSKESG